jgi:hypothetical protein
MKVRKITAPSRKMRVERRNLLDQLDLECIEVITVSQRRRRGARRLEGAVDLRQAARCLHFADRVVDRCDRVYRPRNDVRVTGRRSRDPRRAGSICDATAGTSRQQHRHGPQQLRYRQCEWD